MYVNRLQTSKIQTGNMSETGNSRNMSETGNSGSGKIPYMNLSYAITRTSSWCLFIAEGFLGVHARKHPRWSALVKTGSCVMHRLNRRAFIHLLKCWTEAFHVEKGFKFLFFVIFYFSCFTKIWFSTLTAVEVIIRGCSEPGISGPGHSISW